MAEVALHGVLVGGAALLLCQWLVVAFWAVVVTAYERRRTGTWPPPASVLRHLEQLVGLARPWGRRRSPPPKVAIGRGRGVVGVNAEPGQQEAPTP